MASEIIVPESVTSGLLRAAEQFRKFSKSPFPEVVTDERVTAWVDQVSNLLQSASCVSLRDLGPDHGQYDNLQVRFNQMARTLLRASWLGAAAHSKLREFVAARPCYVRSKYRLTYDCFSSRIPQMRRDLERFVGLPNLHFLEIGSFEGHSACWLLENVLTHETSRLLCVDLFLSGSKELFEHNVGLSGAGMKVEAMAGPSQSILWRLPPSHYDFVYVDGSHDPADVLEDAVMGWRLLKPGGLMTFDDYLLRDVPITQILVPQRPDIGIDAFLSAYEQRYQLVSRGFQLTVQKTSTTRTVSHC